jgi:hypothetical protein
MKKTIVMISLALLGWSSPIAADEWRIGMQVIQVRDDAFLDERGTLWDELPERVRWPRSFRSLQVERGGARRILASDLVVGLRLGGEGRSLEGLSSRYLLAEPLLGLRHRKPIAGGWEAYGSLTASLPLVRASMEGFSSLDWVAERRFATFPMAAGSVGASFHPLLDGRRNLGFSLEAGYTTPALLGFGDFGRLRYGGLRLGAFVSLRPRAPHQHRRPAPRPAPRPTRPGEPMEEVEPPPAVIDPPEAPMEEVEEEESVEYLPESDLQLEGEPAD